ncbi:MAG: hypothetical protein ASARMPRED_002472 [Alectoria sarmentosa]|nr:MAG: hypothetical protein ASARMPRED_002472 [Alectoria sarmentosa]
MSIFGGLANEILLQIIKETSADDIAALASCCKHLHFLAKGRLAFHRKKRATADDIVVGWDMWTTSAIHPSKHLEDIMEDDDIRFYTRKMKIGSLEYGDPEDDDIGGVDGPYTSKKNALVANIGSKYEHQLSDLIAKVYSALLPHAAKTNLQKWTKDVVEKGEPAAVVILLLALYPNLKILHIYEPGQQWWKPEEWGNLLRSLTSTARGGATNRLRIFSRLSKFRLIGCTEDSGMEANAAMISPFMTIPTMRTIQSRGVDGRNIQWPYGTAVSGLIEIYHQVSDIDTESLTEQIRGVKALEAFTYHFCRSLTYGIDDNKLDGEDAENPFGDAEKYEEKNTPRWEPRAITAALLRYASHSLTFLELRATNLMGSARFRDGEPFLGSLRSFNVLSEVRLDTMMLIKTVKCLGGVSLVRGTSWREESWEETKVQWLVDFLPRSIRRFGMHWKHVGRGLSKNEVATMFTYLPERTDALPYLREVAVEHANGQTQEEKGGLEELGLKCEENDIKLVRREEEPLTPWSEQ